MKRYISYNILSIREIALPYYDGFADILFIGILLMEHKIFEIIISLQCRMKRGVAQWYKCVTVNATGCGFGRHLKWK